MYLLYYVVASEYPLRPVVGSAVSVETVVTYLLGTWLCSAFLGLLLVIL